MERRKTQGRPPHLGVRRCPLNGRGQLAFRRSTTALPKGCVVPWCDPGQVSWANRRKRRGSLRRRPNHFQRRTSHAGRNAGRHDARTARERVASPPAGSASRPAAAVCLRGGVLYGRDDSCGYVTERGTNVKGSSLNERRSNRGGKEPIGGAME